MSKSKITILAVSFLLLAVTIFLGYNFKNSDSASSGSSENAQQENSQNGQSAEQKQGNQQPKTQQPTNQQPKSKISYVDSMAKEVAMTVNVENFSAEDFERRLHKTQFVFKAKGLNFENNSAEILKELEETVINELIRERVVMQLAQEFKIVASDEEVKQRLNATKQQFPSQEEWQALLDSRGITEDNLNTYNRIQLTEANLVNWLGGEQQYADYLNKKIAESKVTVNKPLIEELLTKL